MQTALAGLIFLCIPRSVGCPDTALVSGIAERDARGYIITDENQKTSVEGLYAAGDICVKPLRQVITAASDGAVAAAALEKYCGALRGESCI